MRGLKIDLEKDAAIDRFLRLTAIEGISGDEAAVAQAIRGELDSAGIPGSWIAYDDAHQRSSVPGNVGNMILRMPGNSELPTVMLSAHMDTVPICRGCAPRVEGNQVVSDADTGLGGDDRAGCTVVLTAALDRFAKGQEHGEDNLPPAVFAWFIQEEIGLFGARNLDASKLGKVDLAFNFDGGSIEKLTSGAIGGERMTIEISGLAAHAGVAPENGVSAIVIASKAIADLHDRGWLGKVDNEHGVGTANVGVINGGDATNVITPSVSLRAEARSHDAKMRTQIVDEIRRAFEEAAGQVKNVDGVAGKSDFETRVDYESFCLPDDDPSIDAAKNAIASLPGGRSPFTQVADGGLDANWLFMHGVPAVTLGCGQMNIHTVDERLNIPDFLDACHVAAMLVSGVSGDDGKMS
ncbi:MAG: M20/M25/M40 family metallo-hydrolase [Planctomycetota bacterium]